ncbi:unnamed protein product [Calypogeia fissa]
MSSGNKSSPPVVTSYEAAQAVRLKKDWQDRYLARAREVMQRPSSDGQFTVCIVGRAGVGKGTLVNHLLKRRAATVSHNASGNDFVAQPYGFGRLRLMDIPGYDGQHSLASNYRTKKDSGKPEGSLTLEQFVESYKLFGSETDALIFVVNNRITVHDKELMALAVASRKFFCIVRTHADSMARIESNDERAARLSEMEQEIRILKVSIPWPERKISGDQLQKAPT